MGKWKTINGFESYQISTYGNVRTISRKININDSISRISNTRNLKKYITKRGYEVVCLRKDNKNYHLQVHRLVAEHFCEKIELEVNHKDGNKLNNNASNLEWCTHKENMLHAHENGLINRKKNDRFKNDEMELIYPFFKYVRNELFLRNMTVKELSNKIGISIVNLSNILNGRANPGIKTVLKIYNELDLNCGLLINDEDWYK